MLISPTLRKLIISRGDFEKEELLALATNNTLVSLDLSFLNVDVGQIDTEIHDAFLKAVPNNYFICEIIGLPDDVMEQLQFYLDRNRQLQLGKVLDEAKLILANSAIKTIITKAEVQKYMAQQAATKTQAKMHLYLDKQDKKLKKLQVVRFELERAFEMLQEETTENAEIAKVQLNDLITACRQAENVFYQEDKDFRKKMQAYLDAQVIYTRDRWRAFNKSYSRHRAYLMQCLLKAEKLKDEKELQSSNDKSMRKSYLNCKRTAFFRALGVCLQADGTLLTEFHDESQREIFDCLLLDDPHLNAPLSKDKRQAQLLVVVENWKAETEKDRALRVKIREALKPRQLLAADMRLLPAPPVIDAIAPLNKSEDKLVSTKKL